MNTFNAAYSTKHDIKWQVLGNINPFLDLWLNKLQKILAQPAYEHLNSNDLFEELQSALI